jgi:hypothetical protein
LEYFFATLLASSTIIESHCHVDQTFEISKSNAVTRSQSSTSFGYQIMPLYSLFFPDGALGKQPMPDAKKEKSSLEGIGRSRDHLDMD